MPPTKTERIEQEAIKYSNNQVSDYLTKHPIPDSVPEVQKNKLMQIFAEQCINDFKSGATSEANRSKVLVEALEEVKKSCPVGSWFEKRITKALNTYNK